MVDFIGLGAQKAGTSWLYTCLYEHPGVYAPVKEIHFFSRDRFKKGIDWYMAQFAKKPAGTIAGEFSTSYLNHPEVPARIAKHCPNAKLIAVLRNPVERAYSEYRNAIKAGEIPKKITFREYLEYRPEALERGLYFKQLSRYYEYFSRVQLHVAIYEDSKKDPLEFVKAVYTFLEIDPEFVPKMLKQYVNITRTPRFVFIDRVIHKVAETLRKIGLHKLVFWVKKSGVTDAVRSVNTEHKATEELSEADRAVLQKYYAKDVHRLSELLNRDLATEWEI